MYFLNKSTFFSVSLTFTSVMSFMIRAPGLQIPFCHKSWKKIGNLFLLESQIFNSASDQKNSAAAAKKSDRPKKDERLASASASVSA